MDLIFFDMHLLLLIFAFGIGASLGSFMNVCIIRIPNHLSVIYPPSHCVACGWGIKPYLNIPLFSYILLQGKCSNCKNSFSPLHLINELAMGVITLGLYFYSPFWVNGLFALDQFFIFLHLSILGLALLCLIQIDFRHLIVPDSIIYPATLFGLAISPFVPMGFLKSALGVLVGIVIIYTVIYGYKALTKKQAMGLGDANFMAMLGSYIGPVKVISSLLYASTIGSAIIGFYLIITGKSRNTQFPFIPFLATGAVCTYFFDEHLLNLNEIIRALANYLLTK